MHHQLFSLSKKLNVQVSESYLHVVTAMDLLSQKLEHSGIFKKFKTTPKGIYIFGSTGSGKTTIMNKFFESLEVPKLNIHFHDYFLDVSRLLHKYSMNELINKISKSIKVFCFDEFFIESITDAKILQDLLKGLIKKGVIMVFTSNFAPERLYENGFNREVIFPEFSNFLRENLEVFELSSNFDFREKNVDENQKSIFISKTPEGFAEEVLEFKNHKLSCLVFENQVIFEYEELFKKPRSIVEYIFICRKFDKIYINNFRKFGKNNEDELIRFRNFIDIAYSRHNILRLQGNLNVETVFEKSLLEDIKIKRTYSRLVEMQSSKFASEENLLKRKWQNEAREFLSNV